MIKKVRANLIMEPYNDSTLIISQPKIIGFA